MIELRKLKELVKLMVENGLTELDLQGTENERVTLKRGPEERVVHYAPPAAQPAAAPAPAAPAPASAAPASAEAAAPATPEDEGLTTITSPMVGTYYSSPNPDSKAFVNVGDKIGEETVVCLVEAMKVFNEIKAECSGTVQKVLVENGEAVEFGQPLLLVKP